MKLSKEDFEATKFLGGVVGAKFPFLKRIAMLNQEERELIGLVECFKLIVKNEKLLEKLDTEEELLKFLDKVVSPMLERIGETRYKMGEISHLSCRIGSTKKRFKESYPTFEVPP